MALLAAVVAPTVAAPRVALPARLVAPRSGPLMRATKPSRAASDRCLPRMPAATTPTRLFSRAANSVMQQFAGRGLLNSSMASEAAYQAAMAKAIEIAGPDAQTYFAQGRANQDASNVFERDARGYAQENYKMSVDMDKFNRELQYRYDALKIDKETQDDARALAQKYALEMENVRSVNAAYDLYLRRVSDIDSNVNYDAATKVKLKNEAGKDFDLYAKAKGIAWEMSLGNRFSADSALRKHDAGATAGRRLIPRRLMREGVHRSSACRARMGGV